MIAIIDRYIEETGITTIVHATVVDWGLANGHLNLPKADIRKILTRAMSIASRQEYIEDENGEPVRRRHSYKISRGEEQMTFWVRMEDATPEQMRLSSQQRRKGIESDVLQADRDVKYYNKNHNPGDPLVPDWNFNPDVAERSHSGEYDDTPPEETDGGLEPEDPSPSVDEET